MRREEKEAFTQRIRDAGEFLDSAQDNLKKERFKAALVGAGDCAIAANDAFTVFMLQEKASADHTEAVALHKKAGQKISENRAEVLKGLLDLRHRHGYRSVEVSRKTAAAAVSDAEKFLKWVNEKLERF